MRCPERRSAARTWDFGSRIALDVASQQSTVLDSFPVGRANAVRVCVVVTVLPAGSVLQAALLAGNDDENFSQIAAVNINTPGTTTFVQSQVPYAWTRVGLQAAGPGGSAVLGVSAQTANI